jgi:hypothetical protein
LAIGERESVAWLLFFDKTGQQLQYEQNWLQNCHGIIF